MPSFKLPAKKYVRGAGFKPHMVIHHSRSRPLYVICEGVRTEMYHDTGCQNDEGESPYTACNLYSNNNYDLFYFKSTKSAYITRNDTNNEYKGDETVTHIYHVNIA